MPNTPEPAEHTDPLPLTEEPATPRFRQQVVSFVRRSPRLSERQAAAMERVGEDYVLPVPRGIAETSVAPGFSVDLPTAFGREARTVIEIGTGLGECIVAAAATAPETNFLALEVYAPGIAQTVLRADRGGVHNIRLVEANAPELLDALPAASIDEVWVFFPDPWHKSRHHKRRLISAEFGDKVARVLRPGGIWRLATDWEPYADHMREVLRDRGDLAPLIAGSDGVTERFEGRILTSFEAKGQRAGRGATDLAYVRA